MRRILAIAWLIAWAFLGSAWRLATWAAPPELWQDAFSYELCRAAAFSPTQAAVLMPSAVCVLKYASGEVYRYSTSNHLATAQPTAIGLDPDADVLYVGHADGAIDVVGSENSYRGIALRDALKPESEVGIRALAAGVTHLYALQGDRIVAIRRGEAFSVEDQFHLWLNNRDVKPACLLVSDGVIYVGTDHGVIEIPQPIAGSRRYSRLGDLDLPVVALVRKGEELMALCAGAGVRDVYVWRGGVWSKLLFSRGQAPVSISLGSDGEAYCVTESRMFRYRDGAFAEMVCELPYPAVSGGVDSRGAPMLAFREHGAQRFTGGAWRRLYEETPRFVSVRDAAAMGNAVVLTGGHPHEAIDTPFRLYYWRDGRGSNLQVAGARNAGEVVVLNAAEARYLVCSGGSGLYEFQGDRVVAHYDNTNSALAGRMGKVDVWSGIALADGSWWLYNASNDNPLVVRDAQGVWHALPWPDARPSLPPSFAADRGGALWIGHAASNYLLRIDPAEYISSRGVRGFERKGDDLDVAIRCVRVSGDDRLWVGYVNTGIAYALGASGLAGRPVSFALYYFEDPTLKYHRSLPLGEPPIERLLVDHGNNVWIATARGGLAQLMPHQQTIRRLYNVDNSPLPSRFLHSLALTADGTLWIASDRGAMRLLSDSQSPALGLSDVRIYPNPVRPGYEGWITVDGLLEGMTVKITDAGGTLARELYSNGGRALWDGRNGLGEAVESGVYLLFLSNRDGSVVAVEKLVVVR